MREQLQSAAMGLVDAVTAAVPRRRPGLVAVQNCKIISHRGEHDNVKVFENTLPAFVCARENGVWGIECDIRWTADLVPVIHHDPDGERLFGDGRAIAALGFAELRESMPLVPSLAELVAEFGGNTHLMLEIKAEPLRDAAYQKAELARCLAELMPGRDYHFLALQPDLLQRVDFVASRHALLVAELNVGKLSRAALARDCGGLTGHYLLLGETLRRRHEAVGQRLGTGFIGSRNALYRELNRGIEWIFSNDAVAMQAEVDRLLLDGAS